MESLYFDDKGEFHKLYKTVKSSLTATQAKSLGPQASGEDKVKLCLSLPAFKNLVITPSRPIQNLETALQLKVSCFYSEQYI